MPQKYNENPSLGIWVVTQRQKKNYEGSQKLITERKKTKSIGGHRVYMANAETQVYSMHRAI